MSWRDLLNLGLVCFLLSVPAGGGEATATGQNGDSSSIVECDGLVIDSIEINNRDIYDTKDTRYNSIIFRMANRLHVATRARVIRRELLFAVGERFSQELAEETVRNLRRRYSLYDAWIETELLPDGRLLVKVVTVDVWSLSGGIAFSREGNENHYRVGVAERNLLGLNQLLEFTYHFDEFEGDYFSGKYANGRFLGRPFRIVGAGSGNPVAGLRRLVVGRPFYDLSQKVSYGVSGTSMSGRRDFYEDTTKLAQSEYAGDLGSVELVYQPGSERRKVPIKVTYDYVCKSFANTLKPGISSAQTESALKWFPVDSLYHRLGLEAGYSSFSFSKLRQIDGFGRTEDFTLGSAVGVLLSRAFNSDSVVFDALGLGLVHRNLGRFGLLALSCDGIVYLKEGHVLRRLMRLSISHYNNSREFLTLALRAGYRSDRVSDGVDNLVLGGTSGLRGYDKYFKTGERRAVLNAEGRFFPRIEILSVMFGGVVFADIGRTWESDEPLSLRDFHACAGFGLRVSFERSSRTALFRCDVSFSELNGWQLSIGSGQYFGADGSTLPLTTR